MAISPAPTRGSCARAAAVGACLALAIASASAEDAAPGASAPAGEEAGASPASADSPWALPPADACEPEGGLRGGPQREDAPPLPFGPGDAFALDRLPLLRDFLPEALWEHRDRFFYEGMRLVIGACFADYSPPAFFREATRAFAGRARILENGGIADYTAGLPFPPDSIARDDPRAGLRWAWNSELRYQGAGFRGRFRTSDMVGHTGRAEPFEGEIFKAQLSFRADLADRGYEAKGARGKHWVAGGLFLEPTDAREYAWRQYRDVEHLASPERSDDLHAYLPNYRRVRRVSATGVEGLYMPAFSVGVVKPQIIAGVGGNLGGGGGGAGAIGGVAAPASTITTKRSGFEGLELRPLLYDFAVLGVRDVLAPINATTPAYPEDREREFGTWGLSFASDTWDLRRALVVEGRAKGHRGGDQVARFVLYADLQTLYPLYYLSFDSRDEPIDVGVFVGRWSETREDYPGWPDDPERPVRAIDPVGAAFANLSEDGGWRRESWDIVSTPPNDRELQRLLSVGNLTKRR